MGQATAQMVLVAPLAANADGAVGSALFIGLGVYFIGVGAYFILRRHALADKRRGFLLRRESAETRVKFLAASGAIVLVCGAILLIVAVLRTG
jgi:hypothetical protein